jgi:OmpA-OmpF porin, OOP family
MRLRAIAFALAAFGATGAGAWWIGEATADYAERRLAGDLATALAAAGHDWAEIRADGLILTLAGDAPDETARFHAIEIARQAAGPGRLLDAVAVAPADPAAAPAFALELLRSGEDVSLIGLVPADGARETIAAGLAAAGIGATVTDMLETADHPAPPGWDAALAFGLAVLGDLPRAKIAVAPGTLSVTAVAEDATALAGVRREIEARAPADVTLDLDLSAPRPVIAPYSLAFRLVPGGPATLTACSAETEEERDAILAAARAAGVEEAAECRLGLGAPSPDWGAAAVRGIEAVADFGGGSFALTDMDALLIGPPTSTPRRWPPPAPRSPPTSPGSSRSPPGARPVSGTRTANRPATPRSSGPCSSPAARSGSPARSATGARRSRSSASRRRSSATRVSATRSCSTRSCPRAGRAGC